MGNTATLGEPVPINTAPVTFEVRCVHTRNHSGVGMWTATAHPNAVSDWCIGTGRSQYAGLAAAEAARHAAHTHVMSTQGTAR